MQELNVQKYLRSGKSLEALKFEHGVNYRILNGKISFTYDQIAAKNDDPIACECRGLILRESDFSVVAASFFRFFNDGQKEAAKIDWEKAEAIEKLDGTLCIVYFDALQHKWCVATRSMPEAGGNINGADMTFAELFDMAVKNVAMCPGGADNSDINDLMSFCFMTSINSITGEVEYLQKEDLTKFTFMFELVSPYNRIVCKYDNIDLYLLGARNNDTLIELNPYLFQFDLHNIKRPKTFKFDSITHLYEIIKDWSPLEYEGLIIKDVDFNRIKIKTPAYLAASHVKDSATASIRSCVELILLGKEDDVIPFVPPLIKERLDKLKAAIGILIKNVNADYERLKSIDNMKEFALEVQKCMYQAPLFAIKRNKATSVQNYFDSRLENNKYPDSFLDNIYDMAFKIDGTIV